MKRFYLLTLCVALGWGVSSCSKNDPILFEGAFVHIVDETGARSSVVDWESNNYLATYYVYLISPSVGEDVVVSYEVEVGEGLKSGVDYKLIPSTGSPLVFMSGVYRMPIRIEWLRNPLNPAKNNTVKLVLTSCSDPTVQLGKPGPDHLGRSYLITKK